MILRNCEPSSANDISTLVIGNDDDVSTSSLRDIVDFINNDENPTVDLEAVLDILYGSITDVCQDHIYPEDVVHWVVNETLGHKTDKHNQCLETLECLLIAYLDNIVKYLTIVGIIKNGRLPYTFKRLSPGCAVVLQRSNSFD